MRRWLHDMRFAGRFLALVSALLLAFALSACEQETAGPEEGTDIQDIQEDTEGEPAPEDETLDEQAFDEDAFFEDPEPFIGQQVTVSAEVTEVLTPETAFRLTGDDVGGSPLLVVRANQQTAVEEGQIVQVTGTVREFDRETLESEFGLDLADDEFADDRAYIEATDVTVIEGGDPDVESPEATS